MPHVAPPLPHAVVLVVVTQAPAEQQPVGQLVESHTQVPALQRLPAGHAAPEPQPHVPDARHESVCVPTQLVHRPASRPQELALGDATHWSPLQQPAQLAEVQRHMPPTHC